MRSNLCITFSPRHYTEQDEKLLEKWTETPGDALPNDAPMRVAGHGYGYFVQSLLDPERHLRCVERLQQAGASADLIALIQLAHDQGARWIEFDTDAEETDGLAYHDW